MDFRPDTSWKPQMYTYHRSKVESTPPPMMMKCTHLVEVGVGGHEARHNGGLQMYTYGRFSVESPSKSPVAGAGGHEARHNGGLQMYTDGRFSVQSPSKSPVGLKCRHAVENPRRIRKMYIKW